MTLLTSAELELTATTLKLTVVKQDFTADASGLHPVADPITTVTEIDLDDIVP